MSKFTWLDKFIRFLRIRKVKKYISDGIILLDLGCGQEAHFLNLIKNRIKKGIGFDKKIQDQKDQKVKLINLKIEKKIPLPNKSVDYITMLAVLEHLEHPNKVINECHRVLKDQGFLIITTPTYLADSVLNFLAYKVKLIEPEETNDHKKYFSLSELKEILEKNKFHIVKAKRFELVFNNFVLAQKK